MPVARGERFEFAMWRALGIWGCGVALVMTSAAAAAAQEPAPAGSGAGTLSAQAAVVLGGGTSCGGHAGTGHRRGSG